MESTIHGGKPEVELVFEAAGTTYRLHKRFSGTNGTITLAPASGRSLTGDEAEAELARILHVEPAGTPNAASQQWAHLWVWQGDSGCDPAIHANTQKDSLLQRLGQSGGAAIVMQSEVDARVAAAFASARESIFTQRDEPKSTSDLAKLTEALTQARTAHALASERLERVRKALETHTHSSALLVTLQNDLQHLTKEQAGVATRQHRLHELRQQETEENAHARALEQTLASLAHVNREIRELRARVAAAAEKVAPGSAELERLNGLADQHRVAAAEAAKAYDATTDATRHARQEHELAMACVALLEKRQVLAKLTERAAAAASITKGVAEPSLRDRAIR